MRTSLHGLFKRNGINRLPKEEIAEKKPKKYQIGYFHVDITEVRKETGKLFCGDRLKQ